MGIKIFQDRAEIGTLKESVAQQELSGGTFNVVESEKVHLRRLHCSIPNAMRYRIYVPEDRELYLHFGLYYGGEDSRSYVTTETSSLRSGEQIVLIYSGTDMLDADVRTLNVSINDPAGGSGLAVRLEHFRIYENLNTDINGWFRPVPNSLHGELSLLSPEETIVPKALLHLPWGVEAKFTSVQEKPVGAAIWLAPVLDMRHVDERLNSVETTVGKRN